MFLFISQVLLSISHTFPLTPQCAQGSVWRTLWRTYGTTFIGTGFMKLFHDCFMFAPPYILERLLHHMAGHGSRSTSTWLAVALLAVAVVENVTINFYL